MVSSGVASLFGCCDITWALRRVLLGCEKPEMQLSFRVASPAFCFLVIAVSEHFDISTDHNNHGGRSHEKENSRTGAQ